MKKLISSALSLIMLIGAMSLTTVSAASTDVTKTVDFNDLELNKTEAVTDDFIDMDYGDAKNPNDTRRVYYYTQAGLNGKDEDDMCLRINKIWASLNNADADQKWYQLRYNANLTGGNYYHVSTELAFAKDGNSPEILMWCDDMRICNMIYDTTEHTYDVLVGGETKATVPTEEWIKFDIVINASAQTANLYIGGLLVASDIALANEITGLSQFQLGVWCKTAPSGNKTAYYTWNVYMDNLKCSALAEDPGIDRKSEDFNDLVMDKSATVPEGFVEINYSFDGTASGTRKIYYYSKTGQYDKGTDDTCLNIYHEWTNQTSASLKQRYYQLRYNPELTGGNYYHVSTELAFAKDGNSPQILMWCDDMSICNMKYDTSDHTYDVLVNEEVKATVPTEKWVRFDIVINASAQTADLYVDGVVVASDIALAKEITGFTNFQLGVYCNTTYDSSTKKTAYYPWNVYMDNLTCSALAEEPVIEPEEEIPADMEITAVGEAELQENADNLYKKGFIFTTDDINSYNSVLLEADGDVVGGFNIADKFTTIISGGAAELGLQIYDIPEALKNMSAKLSTITVD